MERLGRIMALSLLAAGKGMEGEREQRKRLRELVSVQWVGEMAQH
jgi:hypothetical protein